jgi:hypothetical protein
MKIRIFLLDMQDTGERRTPSEIVEEMGIRYARWESHPIADQIHLIGVDEGSLHKALPSYMTLEP